MDEIQWWHPDDWERALAPLLTGEAQRAYFARSATSAYQYVEVKQEILGHLGLSPICVAQYFTQHWRCWKEHWKWNTGTLEGAPSASQVVERMVIDCLLRALSRFHRQMVGMRNPTTTLELVEL